MADTLIDSRDIDLEYRPRLADDVVIAPVGHGAVAWAGGDKAPIVLDGATHTYVQLFDGATSLNQIVDDIVAVLDDLDPEIDIGLGLLIATQRLGMEGFLDGVEPLPAWRRPSGLYRQLTAWVDAEPAPVPIPDLPAMIEKPESVCADNLLHLDESEFFSVRTPGSPVRVSHTFPELREAMDRIAPDRVGPPAGGLFLSAVAGDANRVGRSFYTLYGPQLYRLVVTPDRDRVVRSALRHLSMPLWLHDEPGLWWSRTRTLIGPDGAILMSPERLGLQAGILRAVERAGFEIVDSMMTAIDPATFEVVVHGTRFDLDRGELAADEADPPRRVPIAGQCLGVMEYQPFNPGTPEFFAKAFAVAVEPIAGIDRARLLEAAVHVATEARGILLDKATPQEVVADLLGTG